MAWLYLTYWLRRSKDSSVEIVLITCWARSGCLCFFEVVKDYSGSQRNKTVCDARIEHQRTNQRIVQAESGFRAALGSDECASNAQTLQLSNPIVLARETEWSVINHADVDNGKIAPSLCEVLCPVWHSPLQEKLLFTSFAQDRWTRGYQLWSRAERIGWPINCSIPIRRVDAIYASPWVGIAVDIQAQHLCSCQVPSASIRCLVKFRKFIVAQWLRVFGSNRDGW